MKPFDNLSPPSQAVRVLAQSAGAVSHTGDTNPFTLASYTIPAGLMGLNGAIRITIQVSGTSSANNKAIKMVFGGVTIDSDAMSVLGQVSYVMQKKVSNRGAANSQISTQTGYNSAFGVSAATFPLTSIDTTAPVVVSIVGQLALGTETITLEEYSIELMPGVN